MRRTFGIAALVLAGTLFTGSAFAQGMEPPPPGAPGSAPAEANAGDDDAKKFGIGGDLLFLLPLGDLADASGPQIGPLFRFGYRVMPPLEITGRIGFLLGLKKERDFGLLKVETGFNLIPVWAGARYFFMDPYAGVYGAAEIGLNVLTPTVGGGGTAGDSQTRFGANVGAGYVISKELPIDIRAQFTLYNLLGRDSAVAGAPGESTYFGLGISGGYTFQF